MEKDPSKFINRELSWLEFNQRVLDEARDETVPPLERLKFLAITASNLDEFFLVRVGGLQELRRQGRQKVDPAGMTPAAQLQAISRRTHTMKKEQYGCYLDELLPALAEHDVRCISAADMSDRQSQFARKLFLSELMSVLTPMAVRDDVSFPILPALAVNLCIRLAPKDGDEEDRYAVIPIARSLTRFITLPAEKGLEYIPVEEVIGTFVGEFFPGETVISWAAFRISRNADLTARDDLATDLVAEMEQVLDARKDSHCVRLEIAAHADDDTGRFLRTALRVAEEDIYRIPGPLDLSAFMSVATVKTTMDLHYKSWPAQMPPEIDPKTSMFDLLSQQDLVLYHPFDSFEPVVRFVEEAADDPDVLAIKQVLYRTNNESRIVQALKKAAANGKAVTAVVELKARFDEARNIEWAKDLERDEVQVIYGVKGFKIHSKVCVIVRREPGGIKRYVHYGTGNYNESTAKLYTDVSLMSADTDLGADATAFFNAINGYSQMRGFRKIYAAPTGLRDKVLELIRSEIQLKREGRPAHIMAKVNSLSDPKIINALYKASKAGVKVELNIRGICCLRPGVPGLSDNISVISIIDRYLEHSRIFYFHHGGDARMFISSADWMPRNLDKRLELLVPVEDARCRQRLLGILNACMNDTVKGRRILVDGSYESLTPTAADENMGSQELLYEAACNAVKAAEKSRGMVLEPFRAQSATN